MLPQRVRADCESQSLAHTSTTHAVDRNHRAAAHVWYVTSSWTIVLGALNWSRDCRSTVVCSSGAGCCIEQQPKPAVECASAINSFKVVYDVFCSLDLDLEPCSAQGGQVILVGWTGDNLSLSTLFPGSASLTEYLKCSL